MDSTVHRWLADMSHYDFDVHYKQGKANADVDGLPRRPHLELEMAKSSQQISTEVVRNCVD